MAVAYPIDVSLTKSLSFTSWADESLDLAKTTVYPGKNYSLSKFQTCSVVHLKR